MRRHKSYKLKNDTIEKLCEELQHAQGIAFQSKQLLLQAQDDFDKKQVIVKDLERKLVQLLAQRPDSYVIFNRVKYELVDGKLTKKLVLN